MSDTLLSYPFIYAAPFMTGHSFKLDMYYAECNNIKSKFIYRNAKISHNGKKILQCCVFKSPFLRKEYCEILFS